MNNNKMFRFGVFFFTIFIILGTKQTFVLSFHSECWWSGCQPRFWLYRGCYPTDQYKIMKSVPCQSGQEFHENTGDIFYCCPSNRIGDSDRFNNDIIDTGTPSDESESGICSWYGGPDIPQGSPTASGQKFDKFALTAAHRTLRFGTRIRVKHSKSGRTVDVVINDRGPFIQRRILDLSYMAFGILEDHDKGLFHCSFSIMS